MTDFKLPEAPKKTPRCPLCHAAFVREHNEMVAQRLEHMVAEAKVLYQAAVDSGDHKKIGNARKWGELLEASIKGGAAEVFICHFCKIGIACNDPFVGRWEEAYAKGDKIFCPACDHEMRYFCTSTGVMLAQCPVKKCKARMKLSSPDRHEGEVPLTDDKGAPLALPNIDRPVATPGQLSDAQAGQAKGEPGLPDTAEIPMPSAEMVKKLLQ